MELYIDEIIEQQDCSEYAVKKRQQRTREILRNYKSGQLSAEEKEILIEAMKKYREVAYKENQARAYNVLLFFYFAEDPLTTLQMHQQFNINPRTVFKDIERGVSDLTIILHGVGGVELLPDKNSKNYIKSKIQDQIEKRLRQELSQKVKKEVHSFIKEYDNITIKNPSIASYSKKDRQQIREILNRIKKGIPKAGERELLLEAMEEYRGTINTEKQKRIYDAVKLIYFGGQDLTISQAARKSKVNQRTIYKYITIAIEELADIIFNMKGGERYVFPDGRV